MKKLAAIGLIFITTNALAICPLKSYSLSNLASKARSLESNFQKLTTCYKDSNIQTPVQDITTAVRKIMNSFSGLKKPEGSEEDFELEQGSDLAVFYGDAEIVDLTELQSDVERAMEAFFQLSQASKDQTQNSECAKSSNARNAWIGLIEVFNGMAPMAMASLSKGAPQLTPYLVGAQAVGSIAQSVLKSLQERAERYSMENASKRNAFIDASCLYHDLALNTFVLDETLNSKGNYYDAILSDLKSKRDKKLEKIHNKSLILDVLSKEFRDMSEDMEDFLSFEYAGNKSEVDEGDGVIEECDYYTDPDCELPDDTCDPLDWGCEPGSGGSAGDYAETYVCSALKRYFNETEYGVKRSTRYQTYLTYFRKFMKDKDVRRSLIPYDVNLEIFTDALNELRYASGAECDVTRLERPLQYFANQLEKTIEKLGHEEPNISVPMNELKKYYAQLKEVSDLSYDAYFVEEKVNFLNRVQQENIDIDLGEIYLLESSINSQLVKGKKYSYSWLEFNGNRGVQFLRSFKTKYDQYKPKIQSSSNKKQNCQLISKLGRDFRVAENMRSRNILYCQIMYPFVNSVDHAEFASLCQKTGIKEYKFEGPKEVKKKRRRFFPIFIGPIVPTPVYFGKRGPKVAALSNLYSHYSSLYNDVQSLSEQNECVNQFDDTKLELD